MEIPDTLLTRLVICGCIGAVFGYYAFREFSRMMPVEFRERRWGKPTLIALSIVVGITVALIVSEWLQGRF